MVARTPETVNTPSGPGGYSASMVMRGYPLVMRYAGGYATPRNPYSTSGFVVMRNIGLLGHNHRAPSIEGPVMPCGYLSKEEE